jgi:hypothetical protein
MHILEQDMEIFISWLKVIINNEDCKIKKTTTMEGGNFPGALM